MLSNLLGRELTAAFAVAARQIMYVGTEHANLCLRAQEMRRHTAAVHLLQSGVELNVITVVARAPQHDHNGPLHRDVRQGRQFTFSQLLVLPS